MPEGLLVNLDTPTRAFLFNVKITSKMFIQPSKQAKKEVRSFYGSWLSGRESNEVYNNSLRRYITVNSYVSGRETSHYASFNPLTKAMVLTSFNEIMRYARKTGECEPKGNRGQRRFVRLISLERKVSGMGTARLTVGVKPDGQLVQYCITASTNLTGKGGLA